MERSPEIKGRPNPIEQRPKKQPSPQTVKQIGKVAIKGGQKKGK